MHTIGQRNLVAALHPDRPCSDVYRGPVTWLQQERRKEDKGVAVNKEATLAVASNKRWHRMILHGLLYTLPFGSAFAAATAVNNVVRSCTSYVLPAAELHWVMAGSVPYGVSAA